MKVKYLYIVILMCSVGLLFSCQTDSFKIEKDEDSVITLEDGRLLMPIRLSIPEQKVIETKTITDREKAIKNVDLCIFSENGHILEKIKGEIDPANSLRVFVKVPPRKGPCKIQLYVNIPGTCRESFNKATIQEEVNEIIMSKLIFEKDSIIKNGLPLISSIVTYPIINTSSLKDNQFDLKFAYARIDVTNKEPEFTLATCQGINLKQNSYLIERNPVVLLSGEYNAVATNQLTGIYLFESSDKPTDLLIKGTNAGFGEGFYKIRITYGDDQKSFEIRRGFRYAVNLTSVKGPGYASAEEAIANEPSNVEYDIVIDDTNSHDLVIANGSYYMGVSNSKYVAFVDGSQSGLVATTLRYSKNKDIPTFDWTNIKGSVTTVGEGLSISSDVIPANWKNDIDIPIKINLTTQFRSGFIKIRVGDLMKTIQIDRSNSISAVNNLLFDFKDSEYVFAEFENSKPDWLSLGDSPSSFVNSTTINSTTGIFIEAEKNELEMPRNASIYISKKTNDQGRIKAYISQDKRFNSADVLNGGTVAPFTYVGAFWRADETGERLIRIPASTGDKVGWWTAKVVWMDSNWSDGDIVLDNSTFPGNPYVTAYGGDAETADKTWMDYASMQVTGNSKLGPSDIKNYTKDNFLYFKIGLKSKYFPSANAPARYAVIALNFNNNNSIQLLYLRQGHDADYLLRPGDKDREGNEVANNRSYAKKFAPYNIAAPGYAPARGFTHPIPPQGVQLDVNGGAFTSYPTQVGAYFQWAGFYDAANSVDKRRLAYPSFGNIQDWKTNKVENFWSNLSSTDETCPPGYRRPNDGSISSPIVYTPDASNAEYRQSIYINPQIANNNSVPDIRNSMFGYYADGFFDRGLIESSPYNQGEIISAVKPNSPETAYIGRLYFNRYNNASLFLPATGHRNNITGALGFTGKYGSYWSSSCGYYFNGAYLDFERLRTYQNLFHDYSNASFFGYAIRCIAND